MSLTLKIISPTNLPPGQRAEFTFDELGGSIGRKPNNDFILVDPERFISSQHACIDYHNGNFLINDTSTNGVFINNSKRPVGSGNSQPLSNGDKISIGEFQLEVILTVAAPSNTGWPDLNTAAPLPDPTATDTFDFDESFAQGGLGSNSIDSVDPLDLLGGVSSNAASQQPSQQIAGGASASPSFVDSIGADLGLDSNSFSQPSTNAGGSDNQFFDDLLDNSPQNIPEPLPFNEPFTPPSAIPDDWDIMGEELIDSNGSNNALNTPTIPPHIETPPVQTTPPHAEHTLSSFPETEFENTTPLIPDTDSLFEDDDIFASLAATAQPVTAGSINAEPVKLQPDQIENLIPATATAAQIPTPPYNDQINRSQPPAQPAPQVEPSSQVTNRPAANPSTIVDNRELLNAFIKGAGLDPSKIETDNPVELLTKLGQLTRVSTEGLMMALRARATIKSSFRVNKTIIAPVENNPLKFSVTAEDALNIIFADGKTGYMSATEAYGEGFKDLQTHQMAMMAGMQAIIKEITEQFSPATLERKFEGQKSGSSFIPGNKKAKNWEMYEVFYNKMTATLQDDFQNVYGEEFARAYENQVRKLS